MKTSGNNPFWSLAFTFLLVACAVPLSLVGKEQAQTLRSLPLNTLDGLDIHKFPETEDSITATSTIATYRGRRALRVVVADGPPSPSATMTGGQALAVIKGWEFGNGSVEADVAAVPREGTQSGSRGFAGIAFRGQDRGAHFEAIYLRMTNGRADDQVRRNHATQYVSEPDFPWHRLRDENPGVYESYVDLDAGAWTHMKIVVAGTRAQLYVNGSSQPCLIVNDLKLGDSRGEVALWTGSDTEAYFSNLSMRAVE